MISAMSIVDILGNLLAVAIVIALLGGAVYQMERTNRRSARTVATPDHHGADTSADRDLARLDADLRAASQIDRAPGRGRTGAEGYVRAA